MTLPPHVVALLRLLKGVRPSGSGRSALCPSHEDRSPSLSIGLGRDDGILLKCHAGCSVDSILSRLGLTSAALWPERAKTTRVRHEICSRAGDVVAVHVRTNKPDGSKAGFMWRRPDGSSGLGGVPLADLPLYGAELLDAEDGPVIVTEGEKAADALRSIGRLALGTVTGAGAVPSMRSLEDLRGRDVILWPDHDEPGRVHMGRIAEALQGVARSVRLIAWGTNEKDDAADFVARGGTRAELARLLPEASEPGGQETEAPVAPAPIYKPDAQDSISPVICLADVNPEPIRWLWTRRLAFGKLMVLDGDPGLGKSTLTLDIAARLTTGRRFPTSDVDTEPGAVLFASAEDGAADTIRPRFDAAGGDPARFYLYGEADGRMLTLPVDVPLLEAEVIRRTVRFVVLDPLSAFLSEKTDTFKDSSVRRALAPLSKMAERTGAAVLVVRHLNKGGGSDPLYRGQGSIGIIGAVRLGLLLGIHPDDENLRVLAVSKSNVSEKASSLSFRIEGAGDGEIKTSRIVWCGPTEHSAAHLVAPAESGDDHSAKKEAVEFLRAELAGGPVEAKRIKERAREEGITDATLRRAQARVGIKPKKTSIGGPWTWELPFSLPPEGAHETPKMLTF